RGDLNLDGIPDNNASQPLPLTLTLGSGQKYTLEDIGLPITLQTPKVEGIIAGKEWRIKNGDGRQFWLQASTDKDGNPILIVRGEQRTYNLAPVSFLLEVVGGATLYDPSTMNNANPTVWVHMDGGFLIQISSTQTIFFFTAGGSIDPLGISGRATGLLFIE